MYLQQCGTTMGSNVAPPYANIFMSVFQDEHIYPHDLFKKHALTWLRNIDDIFCIWSGPTDTLLAFHQYLNSIFYKLQFPLHHDLHQIQFLDTVIVRNADGYLHFDLYKKPTDRNSLLHCTSNHPLNLRKSLPISQYKRVQSIVDLPSIQETRINEMSDRFLERGYPPKLLLEIQSKLTTLTSPSTTASPLPRIPFVQKYHPFSTKVTKIVNKHWPLLKDAYPSITEFQT